MSPPPMAVGGDIGRPSRNQQAPFPVKNKTYKYGCLMAVVPANVSRAITAWAARNIDKKHLACEGLEDAPHITIKYGMIDPSTECGRKVLQLVIPYGPIRVKLTGISLFEDVNQDDGSKADCLKLDVSSPSLHALNQIVSGHFECEDKYPEYKPHLTLAYLNPKHSSRYKYLKPPFLGTELVVSELEYSTPEGEHIKASLVPPGTKGKKAYPRGTNAEGKRPSQVHMDRVHRIMDAEEGSPGYIQRENQRIEDEMILDREARLAGDLPSGPDGEIGTEAARRRYARNDQRAALGQAEFDLGVERRGEQGQKSQNMYDSGQASRNQDDPRYRTFDAQGRDAYHRYQNVMEGIREERDDDPIVGTPENEFQVTDRMTDRLDRGDQAFRARLIDEGTDRLARQDDVQELYRQARTPKVKPYRLEEQEGQKSHNSFDVNTSRGRRHGYFDAEGRDIHHRARNYQDTLMDKYEQQQDAEEKARQEQEGQKSLVPPSPFAGRKALLPPSVKGITSGQPNPRKIVDDMDATRVSNEEQDDREFNDENVTAEQWRRNRERRILQDEHILEAMREGHQEEQGNYDQNRMEEVHGPVVPSPPWQSEHRPHRITREQDWAEFDGKNLTPDPNRMTPEHQRHWVDTEILRAEQEGRNQDVTELFQLQDEAENELFRHRHPRLRHPRFDERLGPKEEAENLAIRQRSDEQGRRFANEKSIKATGPEQFFREMDTLSYANPSRLTYVEEHDPNDEMVMGRFLEPGKGTEAYRNAPTHPEHAQYLARQQAQSVKSLRKLYRKKNVKAVSGWRNHWDQDNVVPSENANFINRPEDEATKGMTSSQPNPNKMEQDRQAEERRMTDEMVADQSSIGGTDEHLRRALDRGNRRAAIRQERREEQGNDQGNYDWDRMEPDPDNPGKYRTIREQPLPGEKSKTMSSLDITRGGALIAPPARGPAIPLKRNKAKRPPMTQQEMGYQNEEGQYISTHTGRDINTAAVIGSPNMNTLAGQREYLNRQVYDTGEMTSEQAEGPHQRLHRIRERRNVKSIFAGRKDLTPPPVPASPFAARTKAMGMYDPTNPNDYRRRIDTRRMNTAEAHDINDFQAAQHVISPQEYEDRMNQIVEGDIRTDDMEHASRRRYAEMEKRRQQQNQQGEKGFKPNYNEDERGYDRDDVQTHILNQDDRNRLRSPERAAPNYSHFYDNELPPHLSRDQYNRRDDQLGRKWNHYEEVQQRRQQEQQNQQEP